MTIIQMENISKEYPNGVTALHDLSVKIDSGEFVYVVGHSGAGKSSFLKLIYREEKASSGEIIVNGYDLMKMKNKEIPYFRRDIGTIFQDYKLLPNKTVYENIAYAMQVIGKKNKDIKKRVYEVLDLVGLAHKDRMFPDQLSGGEQQRVAIARAIVNMPTVLVADEPTGNLDPENSWEIMEILEQINMQGTTVIMGTHNINIVNTIKHRVLTIDSGEIIEDDENGEYRYD